MTRAELVERKRIVCTACAGTGTQRYAPDGNVCGPCAGKGTRAVPSLAKESGA
jgi:DnaJ-class molecular chaperone